MEIKPGELLAKIDSPADLKKLKIKQLPQLCDELRQYVIEQVSINPGHLGANLGVIELTVAVHYVFDLPEDQLVWDVGHQAYAHKILTGRRDNFHLNRTYKGISGFPKIEESEYDSFGTGHSSTSVSAALGLATASALKNEDSQNIAVIGDGAMTGGMAMEALNNAGVSNTNLLVILNDNGIAIDKSTGALKEYLADITTSKVYNKFKDFVWKLMGGGTPYGRNSRRIVQQISSGLKSTILKKSNLFEAFNLRYFGPVDGHDVNHLVKMLKDIKRIQGPKLLHVVTTKGKGFKMAEKHKVKYHAPGYFDKDTGEIIKNSCEDKLPPKYQVVFGKTIIELAEKNDKIVGVTPAMPTGCSLDMMIHKMPKRAFDVGIAEQHAVTFSAGMAKKGLLPFCNIYSSFMQRAYDQVIHDVALQNLNVVLCLDRGGLVGEDGATHHGVYDLAYFRSIPNLTIAAPMNEEELRNLMYTSQLEDMGPFVIRYPRGRGVMPDWKTDFKEVKPGTSRLLNDGEKVGVISLGHPGNTVQDAIEELAVEGVKPLHLDMRYLKPIDKEALHNLCKEVSKIVTVEDGTVVGGLGSSILEFVSDNKYKVEVVRLGVPDSFIEQGTPAELIEECGFDKKSIKDAILQLWNS
jgi:1-deoxy-D-xylulose-5-phosphate synthase